jgi:formylglycine-generating enzyme required for sulfatase activity
MKTIASLLVLLTAFAYAADEATPKTATKDAPFVNSLGMKFVPAPGTKVLFGIRDTRVKDFRAYAKAMDYHQIGGVERIKAEKGQSGIMISGYRDENASWEHPGFEQTEDHPVVGVSWIEAKAFCAWLSKKEGRVYRIPTGAEWTAAAGRTKFPWGDNWPPPKGSGNFGDKAFYKQMNPSYHSDLGDYDDGYAWTSPVGKFAPNWLGLYDMAGNVLQWCEDWHDPGNEPGFPCRKECRLLRGSSWENIGWENLRSEPPLHQYESFDEPNERSIEYGFRCVLEIPAE